MGWGDATKVKQLFRQAFFQRHASSPPSHCQPLASRCFDAPHPSRKHLETNVLLWCRFQTTEGREKHEVVRVRILGESGYTVRL